MPFEDHVDGVRKVLKSLHGLNLRSTKCDLFKREVRYVGRLVSAMGVSIDPKDLEGDVQRIVGFFSYYHSYIQDFSRVATPIYEFLQPKKNKDEQPPERQGRQRGKGAQMSSETPVE